MGRKAKAKDPIELGPLGTERDHFVPARVEAGELEVLP